MEIIRKLDELNRIDPSISEVIDKDVTKLPQIIEQQNTGNYFFRAVKLANLLDLQNWNEENFKATAEYKITEYGRLNEPHESMMYFSNRPEQTLVEIGYDYKTPVVIAAYKVQIPFNALAIGKDYLTSSSESKNVLLPEIKSLFSQKESLQLNKITTGLRDKYDLFNVNAKAWTFPIMNNEDSEDYKKLYNLAMYPGLVRDYLSFAGAVVISNANLQGKVHVEFCFDNQYRLDYIKGYPELKTIFELD